MNLIYFSKTGNVQRFINKLHIPHIKIVKGDDQMQVKTDTIVLTYTTGMGEVPAEVDAFCKKNNENIKYVIASGNRNWGKLFANSADEISNKYNAQILYKFELSGLSKDVTRVEQIITELINAKEM